MFGIRLIASPIALSELRSIAEQQFGSLVKAVIDIEKKIMVIGGEMHADEEIYLLNEGSKQENLWGINIYPDQHHENRIEFDSMINIRPYMGNRSRGVENPEIQKIILAIVKQLITE